MTTTTIQPVTYGSVASLARFSVARYQKMIETGILTGDDKVELLENYVVLKMPKNPAHDGTIDLVKANVPPIVPSGWLVRIQQTLVLVDSQLEPDISVVRGNARTYLKRHPEAFDAGAVIEVAESSLLRDQKDKTRIFARCNIPYYGIINFVDSRIEVYSKPSGPTAAPTYGCFAVYQPGDNIPLILDGVTVGTVPVADLLP